MARINASSTLLLLFVVFQAVLAEDTIEEQYETWGVRSSCSGCASVQAHVMEKAKLEILHFECTCPAAKKGGAGGKCECESQFDWWWNLQCAKNVSVTVQGCHEAVTWTLVSGNLTGSAADKIETSAGSCENTDVVASDDVAGGAIGHQCNEDLGLARIGSTRRVTISLSTPRRCLQETHMLWELPIASDLVCTNVAQVVSQVKRGDAGELVVIVVMLCIGICLGFVLCRRKRRSPFEEKPSRYFSQLEGSDALEMARHDRNTL
mmetsp:Transcript_43059/g.101260  ORF Transcript_43059/g.101260 Transcript_43059/m.101260 type:complete len:264 (-) Transcript_43059:49-840(-)